METNWKGRHCKVDQLGRIFCRLEVSEGKYVKELKVAKKGKKVTI